MSARPGWENHPYNLPDESERFRKNWDKREREARKRREEQLREAQKFCQEQEREARKHREEQERETSKHNSGVDHRRLTPRIVATRSRPQD